MATAAYGPKGPFKEKIGPLYGYIWNGRTIIRTKPKIPTPDLSNNLPFSKEWLC